MNTSLSTLAFPLVKANPTSDWRTQSIATYQQNLPHALAAIRTYMASRLRILIGRVVSMSAIFVDADEQRASIVVDTIMFRLQRQTLVLVRPCAWCGTGEFESPPLAQPVDVGYALSAWQPLHEQCQAADPENWLESD